MIGYNVNPDHTFMAIKAGFFKPIADGTANSINHDYIK